MADLSRVLAGPYATMLLADYGATVVKVERPGVGDDTRAWGPPYSAAGQSTYFESVNRGKLSIALDFTSPEDLTVARRLTDVADVVVENYAPGSLTRYGLDATSVRERNPRAVYCSISGFGAGPGAAMPGYDLLVQAMGGLMSVTGHAEPTKVGVAVVDVLTGLHASTAILAALRHRDATGQGQTVEISLLSALLSSMVNQTGAYVGAGQVPGLLGNAHPSIAPYEVYQARDRPMVIAVGNDAQFRNLADAMGVSDLADDPRFLSNAARVTHRDELNAALTGILAQANAHEWQARLTTIGVPCGPINSIADAFALAGQLGLPSIVDVPRADGPVARLVANPVTLGASPISYDSAPPSLDADRTRVLDLLGRPG